MDRLEEYKSSPSKRKGHNGEKENWEKKYDKTWSSVSNSSLVRPWFQSETKLHFKKIFGPEIFKQKTNIISKKNLVQKLWIPKNLCSK